MSADADATTAPNADMQSDMRIDLMRRFLQAAFADTSLLRDIPHDVVFFLLPDDDPAFVEGELLAATDSARRGKDVYLRHVRVAELPPLPDGPTGPVGQRRTFFNWDGSIAAQEICGPDGEWHAVDPPEPVDDL